MGAPHHSKHIDKRPEPDEKLKYMLIVRSCTDKIRVYLSYVLSRAGFITVSFLAELVSRRACLSAETCIWDSVTFQDADHGSSDAMLFAEMDEFQ